MMNDDIVLVILDIIIGTMLLLASIGVVGFGCWAIYTHFS